MAPALEELKLPGQNFFKSVIDVGVLNRTQYLMDAFPDSHHHLFEPVAAYHKGIQASYSTSDIEHTLYPIALSNQSGELFLHEVSIDGGQNITHSIIRPEPFPTLKNLVKIEKVAVSRLDDFFGGSELDPLTYLVKIDVDGLEEKIIDGGNNTIKNAAFVIVEAPMKKLTSRANRLEGLGFTLFDIVDPAYYCRQLWQVDLIFVNNDIRNGFDHFRPRERTGGAINPKYWEHFQLTET